MSKIKVNSIVNRNDDGGPELLKGAKVPSGQILSINGGVSVSGVATAASFVGDGSTLQNLNVPTKGKVYALRLVLGDPPLQR